MNRPPRPGARNGFSLVELLVVIAIIAVLVGLLLPAVQKVRQAAARSQCQNNLKQLALACSKFHDVQTGFPAYYTTYQVPGGTSVIPWNTAILPYLEQENRLVSEDISTPVKTYQCPSNQPSVDPVAGVAMVHYLSVTGRRLSESFARPGDSGVVGAVGFNPGALFPNYYRKVKIDFVKDGTSNTLLVGERPPVLFPEGGGAYIGWNVHPSEVWDTESMLWAEARNGSDTAYPEQRGCGSFPVYFRDGGSPDDVCASLHFWSRHPGGANFALVDGSVRFFRYAVGTTLIPDMATRDGGEVLPPD